MNGYQGVPQFSKFCGFPVNSTHVLIVVYASILNTHTHTHTHTHTYNGSRDSESVYGSHLNFPQHAHLFVGGFDRHTFENLQDIIALFLTILPINPLDAFNLVNHESFGDFIK